MSQCTGVDKIWSALYSSGALAEREVENKIGHAFSTFAVVVLALGHFAKLADCGFATIYLIHTKGFNLPVICISLSSLIRKLNFS